MDGEAIGDSTRIIAALESRCPVPPLYPADPAARRRALEIEDFFDEQLGPHLRLLVISQLLREPKLILGTFFPDLGHGRRLAALATFPLHRRGAVRSFGIGEASVELAWAKVRAAGECFQEEIQPSGYLVGDSFSVADLTVAALVAPVVAPKQFPYPQPQRGHPLLAELRDALAEAGIFEWACEMYARHRGRCAEVGQE
jgi:glutathione S-transferase